jgi:hypothetical protein
MASVATEVRRLLCPGGESPGLFLFWAAEPQVDVFFLSAHRQIDGTPFQN